MAVKRKHLALLLASALSVAVFVYFLRQPKNKVSEEAPRLGRATFTFQPQDVAALTIQRSGETVRLENRNERWVLKHPMDVPANQAEINAILDELARAITGQALRTVPREAATYGLNPPAVTLELRLKNGTRHSVHFGDPDASKQFVYTLLDNAPEVILLPVYVAVRADQPLINLRDSSLFEVAADEINLLRLHNEYGQIILARDSDEWRLERPLEAVADRVAVESLLGEVKAARITEFLTESSPKAKGSSITLVAQLAGGTEKTLTLGAKVDGFSLATLSDRSQSGKVEAALYDRLNVKPASFLDRNIIRFDPEALKSVVIKNQHQTLTAKQQDDKWMVETPLEFKGKELDLQGTLNSLRAERANEVLAAPTTAVTAKLARPVLTAQFVNKNGRVTTLLFSAPESKQVYVRQSGSPFVYRTEPYIFDRLNFRVKELLAGT